RGGNVGSSSSGGGGGTATGSGGSSGGNGGAATPATGGGSGEADGGGPGAEVGGTGGSGPSTGAMGDQVGGRPPKDPAGAIKPTGDQGALDAAVKVAYDKWKAAYVAQACDGYVVKTAGATTTSAALGHGMIITAMMAGHDAQAQTIFDGLFAVGRKFPSIL